MISLWVSAFASSGRVLLLSSMCKEYAVRSTAPLRGGGRQLEIYHNLAFAEDLEMCVIKTMLILQ